jgi:hypothetical protein
VDWTQRIFSYCERGQDPSFWAEPLNATTNAAFIIAALAAGMAFARQPGRADRPELAALILLVFIIGVGSFLFHTTAARWAALADVIPIGLFMLAYLAYALRVYLKLGWTSTVAGLALFVGALKFASGIECRPGILTAVSTARGPCLNGTLGYAPALFAMLVTGSVLLANRHPAARYLFAAGGIFLVSMFFRSVDVEVCAATRLGGRVLGTHFLWHILNATTLYLLLIAAVRHGFRNRT